MMVARITKHSDIAFSLSAIALLLGIVGSGCSLESKRDVTVSFTVPTPKDYEIHSRMKTERTSISNTASHSAMFVGFPDTVTDFDCYALNITGEGIVTTPYSGKTGCDDLGQTTSLVPVSSGSTLSIDVTAGPARKISLIGVKTGYGCSSDTLANLLLSKSNTSLPTALYKIAETTTDLYSDTSVNLTNAYNASAPENALSCFDAEGPYISAISATYSPLGGGQTVTIDGQNFRSGITVNVGTASCSNLSLVSSRQLTCTLPAQSTAGTYSVTVTNTDTKSNTYVSNITYYSPLSATTNATSVTASDASTTSTMTVGSSITITPSGGVGPYAFSVDSSFGTISSEGIFSSTAAGQATLTITDSLGSSTTVSVTIVANASPSPSVSSSSAASPSPSPSTGGLSFYSYVYVTASPSPVSTFSNVTTLSMHAGSGVSLFVRSATDGDAVLTASTANVISFPSVWASASPSASASSSTTNYTVSLTRASPTPSASSSQSTTDYAEGYVYISAPSAATSSSVTISGIQTASGATGSVALSVYPAFSATPASSSVPAGGSTSISVSGGVGALYGSAYGGSVTQTASNSFQFTAASSGYSNGYVTISDSIGGYAYNYFTITAASLAISPSAVTLTAGNSTTFSASGGTSPYIYSVYSGSGTINVNTGYYTSTSGNTGTFTVRVTDSQNNTSDATVTVNSPHSISPSWRTIGLTDTITISSSGGVAPISWSIYSPVSAAPTWITASGNSVIYQNSDYPESVTLRAVDSLGNSAYTTIHTVNRTNVSGGASTCAINQGGAVKCWGNNDSGVLGLGDTLSRGDSPNEMGVNLPQVNLGTNRSGYSIATWHAEASSIGRTCAILDTGDVKCWGENASSLASGSLGYGDSLSRGIAVTNSGDTIPNINLGTNRKVLDLAVAKFNSCAVLDDHQVKCWGDNLFGELGTGDTVAKGGSPSDMGDYLPNVNLGTNRTAKVIAGAQNNRRYCAILDTDELKCWGDNLNGELGYGDTVVRGDVSSKMGDNLPAIYLGTSRTARKISLGYSHTCVLLDNGNLKCWGANTFGQLGYGDTRIRGDEPNEMGPLLPPINVGTGRSTRFIAAGFESTCLITDHSQVKCFGKGGPSTALGYGDTLNRGDVPQTNPMGAPFVTIGVNRTVQNLKNADGSVCVLLDDNSVRCWGSGTDGRSGYGDTVHRGDSFNEMGTFLPSVQIW